MARNHKLNLAQRRAAEILAGNDYHNMTLAQIDEHVGVSERTLYRWKQDKDFIRYQNELADQLMEDFLAEAYNTLKGMVRKGRSDHSRIKALELVLKNRGKLTDVHHTEAKVEDTRSNEAIEEEIAQLRKELGIDADA
jgi:AcrR family transcriptional regulator